jgi:hypothetical protein
VSAVGVGITIEVSVEFLSLELENVNQLKEFVGDSSRSKLRDLSAVDIVAAGNFGILEEYLWIFREARDDRAD